MSELAQETCIPCRGGVPPLKGEELDALQVKLGNGWQIINEHHLEKEYIFADFRQALDFTVKVGEVAENQDHHPDIYLAWGIVKLTIWTHKIDGLTEKTLSELKNIQKEMFGAAKKILDERVVRVSEYQQFKKELENGKMIDCSWCGNQTCEDKIKEETSADLRVIPSDNTKAETCIYCKNSGTTNVLFARGY